MKANMVRLLVFLGLIALSTSCDKDKDNDVVETQLLTSVVWGKPVIVHNPSGYYTWTTCGESYTFTSKGYYKRTNDCNSIIIEGSWKWTQPGKEIRLETFYNNFPQKTYIISVLELTNDVLHTIEREEAGPADTGIYWELKYRPREN
jgi:hypothetical protein